MKKALIILSLYVIFTSCGGSDTTTTTVQDTTTTTSVVGNLCDSCTYLSISELSSNPQKFQNLLGMIHKGY